MRIVAGSAELIILNNAAQKINDFNEYPNDQPRESYHRVLTVRQPRMSFVDKDGSVSDEYLQLIDWALRSYFRMNRGNRMGESDEFLNKLGNKLRLFEIKRSLKKFLEVSITTHNLDEYKPEAERIYESLSNPQNGLSRDHTYFCVGATKVMHCLFPEFFIPLDKNVAESLKYSYYFFTWQHNNFTSYWKAMKICRNELMEWQRINGSIDSLLKLDVSPTTLTRIFDKCATIMAIQRRAM